MGFPELKVAGQAGVEPATTGFGVRRSNQLELLTPFSLNFDLTVLRMRPTRRTILLQGQFFCRLLSVFGRGVILAFALIAGKADELSHGLSSYAFWSPTE
jgi:hypothetical protein